MDPKYWNPPDPKALSEFEGRGYHKRLPRRYRPAVPLPETLQQLIPELDMSQWDKLAMRYPEFGRMFYQGEPGQISNFPAKRDLNQLRSILPPNMLGEIAGGAVMDRLLGKVY